ncbi:MAG: iron ABC transporter permease [Burkholderiales bacterium]|nr:MAG: iron ABC transporter permease [Burkholderiales bacterium]
MPLKIIRERLASMEGAWALGAIVVALFMSVPIFAILAAFFAADQGAWRHLQETLLLQYIFNSTLLMLLTGIIAGALGVGCAWLVAATEFPARRLVGVMLVLPLAAPAYILAYFYSDLLDESGPVQSWLRSIAFLPAGASIPSIRNLPGAAVVLGVSLYPYVYLLARRAFERQAADTFSAARSLGHGPLSAFWRVALPSARPAVAGGLVLVMMETLADFGVADHFAIPTFSTGIFRSWLLMGDQVSALKLSGVLLAFIALLVWLEARSRGGREASTRSLRLSVRMPLGPVQASLALLACLVPILIGFVVPVVGFLIMSLKAGDAFLQQSFFDLLGNSLGLALAVALIACILAVFLAYASRLTKSGIVPVFVRLSTLGYALPGALLAIGLLAPLGQADQGVTRFLAQNFGWSDGLVLTGTLIALIYACVVRFLTVAYNSVDAGLSMIPSRLEEAARSLKEKPLGVMRRVHLPLIAPSLGAGGLLVMIDVMRELPATLILRPFGFETLSTRIHRLASDERLADAATACLALLVLGVALVLISLRGDRDRAAPSEAADPVSGNA